MHLTHNVALFFGMRLKKFNNKRKQKLSVNEDHLRHSFRWWFYIFSKVMFGLKISQFEPKPQVQCFFEIHLVNIVMGLK